MRTDTLNVAESQLQRWSICAYARKRKINDCKQAKISLSELQLGIRLKSSNQFSRETGKKEENKNKKEKKTGLGTTWRLVFARKYISEARKSLLVANQFRPVRQA